MIWSGITGWPNSTEVGQLGRYGYQGAAMSVDVSSKDGKMGSGCCKFQGEEADNRVRAERGRGNDVVY